MPCPQSPPTSQRTVISEVPWPSEVVFEEPQLHGRPLCTAAGLLSVCSARGGCTEVFLIEPLPAGLLLPGAHAGLPGTGSHSSGPCYL